MFHEEHIHGGYADYVFKKANGDDLLFIEAKKEGVFLNYQYRTKTAKHLALYK